MRTLVVDDEKNIRRTMAMALESMDHEVVCASSGAEAIKELKTGGFDVVFLDLKLHQENGLEVLEEILRLWQPDGWAMRCVSRRTTAKIRSTGRARRHLNGWIAEEGGLTIGKPVKGTGPDRR